MTSTRDVHFTHYTTDGQKKVYICSVDHMNALDLRVLDDIPVGSLALEKSVTMECVPLAGRALCLPEFYKKRLKHVDDSAVFEVFVIHSKMGLLEHQKIQNLGR